MNKKISFCLLIIFIFIVGFIYYFYSDSESYNSPAKLVTINEKRNIKEVNNDLPKKIEQINPPSENFSLIYAQAKDMRSFISYAKQHPEKGGYGYALKGMQKCRIAKDFIRNKSSLQYDNSYPSEKFSARQKSFEYLQYLCQGFSDNELSDDAVNSLSKEGILKNDPFISIKQIALSTSTENDPKAILSAKDKMLKSIFTYKDPLLISDYGMRAGTVKTDTGSNFFLNGRSYKFSSNDGLIMRAAWSLAACEMKGDCSSTNEEVVSACIISARCHNSLTELIKEDLASAGDKDGQWYQRAIMYSREIIDAINRGDTQAFRPPQ